MADIAIFVAEEYERRVSELKRMAGGAEVGQEINFVFCVSVLAHKLKSFGADKSQQVKWVLEPRSQIAMAASNSFFSA